MKKLFIVLLVTISQAMYGQKVVGYYYGSANVPNGGSANNYLVELIIKQNGTAVQGIVNYYFKNTFRSFK
ncbi:MAG: hypothetical protein ABR503_10745, partial [Chitinophagaceae bacterium]